MGLVATHMGAAELMALDLRTFTAGPSVKLPGFGEAAKAKKQERARIDARARARN
jgi:hypothetical protein